jgi:hypothetical protein
MSPVMRTLRAVATFALVLVVCAGCTKKRSGSPFDPDSGHPEEWLRQHPAAFLANSGSCIECHGADMAGGISKVSCFSVSFEDQSCHPGGPRGGHPAGWAAASSHGAGAKAAGGFASCKVCHGSDFTGGATGLSCFGCHGVRAPHPRKPWRGALSHTGTEASNAAVCAQCHQTGNPGPPGCYNNTLCHATPAGHPIGWGSPGQHGAAAKAAPGSMQGFDVCRGCHGSAFGGGAAQSCYPCHNWPPGQNSAHGRSGWVDGGSSHRSTNPANAPVCALSACHQQKAPGIPGCFNDTICHAGGGSHPDGWAAAGQHGGAALGSPGYNNCRECHGSNFGGGTGPTCLSTETCHRRADVHGRIGWGGEDGQHTDQGRWEAICRMCHTNGCTTCHGPKD